MYGVIQDAPHVHKRTVTVNPIVRSYHAPGEPPYHKFNCPVCQMVGNTNIGITPGLTLPTAKAGGFTTHWIRKSK